MGSDMLVVLREASANQAALFGVNHYSPLGARHVLRLLHGGIHDHHACPSIPANEMLQTRPVCAVLGLQQAGEWGFVHGINEHHVAISATPWRSRLAGHLPSILGTDLVRITLERSHSCTQAVDTLATLISRYGQRSNDVDGAADNVFLVADGREAYVVEAAGNHWAMLECVRSRAVTEAALIRQDWHRLSPGLAEWAIEHALWTDDGSKLDFVGVVGLNTAAQALARRRWGRASVALAQQDGAIDQYFVRRMLGDHFEASRLLLRDPDSTTLAATFVAGLDCDREPLAWCAFGPPRVSLHFPIPLAGELPLEFSADHPENPGVEQCIQQLMASPDEERLRNWELSIVQLQERFDRDAIAFRAQAAELRAKGNAAGVRNLASAMMHQHIQCFETEWRRHSGVKNLDPVIAQEEEMIPFGF